MCQWHWAVGQLQARGTLWASFTALEMKTRQAQTQPEHTFCSHQKLCDQLGGEVGTPTPLYPRTGCLQPWLAIHPPLVQLGQSHTPTFLPDEITAGESKGTGERNEIGEFVCFLYCISIPLAQRIWRCFVISYITVSKWNRNSKYVSDCEF